MGLKEYIKKFKKNYVINKAKNTKLPDFNSTFVIRKSIIFAGNVQNVGFRLEVYELAIRLKLAGWVKNLLNGDVEAEIEGEEDKISFLIDHMKSLKRASVKRVDIKDIQVKNEEHDFKIKM